MVRIYLFSVVVSLGYNFLSVAFIYLYIYYYYYYY